MFYKKLPFFLLASLNLFGAEQTTPAVSHELIENELKSAEEEFKKAKKMFNPWYTGPLLTPPANILSPGYFNIQPYLFLTNNYARFDESGKSHDIPNLRVVNPSLIFQFGITSWMDGLVSFQGVRSALQKHSSVNWGDTSFGLGFSLLKEGPYNPALLIALTETFPTGKYDHLKAYKHGTDATGAGSYETKFSFNISKVIWWVPLHPMSMRLSLNYTVPSLVSVHGLNAYGGATNTHGKVCPGQGFQGDFGYEYSFSQMWVFALDVVYTYSAKTTFSGHKGSAPTSGPFNDQLSFAPAIEYNPNENFGILGGVWFSAWGRNSFNFLSGVMSLEYTF